MNVNKIRDMIYKQLRSGASHYEAIAFTERKMIVEYLKDGKYTEREIRAFVNDAARA